MLEFVAAAGLALATIVMWRFALQSVARRRHAQAGLLFAVSLGTIAAGGVLLLRRSEPEPEAPLAALSLPDVAVPEIDLGLPKPLEPEHGFAGSESCRSCHPDEHASWHASFHRTMTQPASHQSVLAPFDDVELSHGGRTIWLQQRGDEYWVDMVDPDWERQWRRTLGPQADLQLANAPRIAKQIVMTTGSHHKQTYWMQSASGDFLIRFPWNYRLDDERWLPVEFDFLSPPSVTPEPFLFSVWNSSCFQCHAVGGQPRYASRAFDTHVAELGIACEACHGPGSAHVAAAEAGKRGGGDASLADEIARSIVNPRDCAHDRSAQICGQCHSFFWPKDLEESKSIGSSYRAGDDLHASRHLFYYTDDPQESWLVERIKERPNYLESIFWADGAVRVTGRDYNGLLATACFQRGELSCLSCHSMHDYEEPNDQLGREMLGNRACLQCHTAYADGATAHTHHAADSSGSLCYNCHMPHTTYGLFKAVRSHRIDSPSVASSVQTGRPNACNLCHLDKTLDWSARHLAEWYGAPGVELADEDRRVAASLLWLLRGDAAQRAIAAWHLSWQPARDVSGEDWQAALLAQCLVDSYPAVRNVARRSIRQLPGFSQWDYDFLAPPEQRAYAKHQVLESWKSQPATARPDASAILLTPEGALDQSKVDDLLRRQDHRPLEIAE